MNKIIQELAEKSRKRYTKTDGSGEFWVFDESLFGELIVRECISEMQISKKGDRYTCEVYDNEYNRAIQDQIEWLKEHFGLEE